MEGKLGHKTRQIPIVFIFILGVFILLSCGSARYEKMDAEDLEILYENGEKKLLPLVCYKYAEEYLNCSDKDEEEFLKKMFHYCNKSYQINRDQRSARYLSLYYGTLSMESPKYFLNYIYYTKLSGEEETIANFIKNDAKVFAIVDHLPTSLTIFQDIKTIYDVSLKLELLRMLFEKYLEDLKANSKLVLLSNKRESIILEFENVCSDLKLLEKEVKELIATIEVASGHARQGYLYLAIVQLEQLKEIVEKVGVLGENLIESVGFLVELIKEIKKIRADYTKCDKNIIAEISDILEEFYKNKEKYQEEYDTFLKEKIHSLK